MKKLLCAVLALAMMFSGIVLANADEQITLRYAAIEDLELTKALAAQFEATHPNIHVEIVELDRDTYNDGLDNLAATQSLPDVFWNDPVTDAVLDRWIICLDEFYAADEDTKSISPAIMKYAQIGGKMYCVPAACKPTVALLNKTLFEKYNVELPAYDWTLDDYAALAEELAHPEAYDFGVAAQWNLDEYFFTHYGWDGEKYAFGPNWVKVMEMASEWRVNGVGDTMTDEEKEAVLGSADANVFDAGHVAMRISAQEQNWDNLAGFLDGSIADASGCEFVVYPMPRTELASNEAIMYYAVISASCEHPQEAWELAKWMTWGKEATLLRQDIMTKKSDMWCGAPMIMDEDVWADMVDKAHDGLKFLYQYMEPIRPDVYPTAPNCLWMNVGYYFGGVFDKFVNGETTPADYEATMIQMGEDNLKSWWDAVNAQ